MSFRSLLKAAALVGVLVVSSARAQQVGDGAKTVPIGTKQSSVYMADSTGRVFRSDVDGNILTADADRDRDFPVITSLFSSVVLNPSTAFQQGTAIYIGQYSKPTLMLRYSYAAAADSDSTFIMVRVWGKTSINSGTLHLWTPFAGTIGVPGVADTCYCNKTVADSAGAATACITPLPSFVVTRAVNAPTIGWTKVVASVYGGTATTRTSLREIPASALRFGGAQGAMLPLVDQAGSVCPFPYILVEVWNLSFTRALTSVSCDVWPRVN